MRKFVLLIFCLIVGWAFIWCLCSKRDKVLSSVFEPSEIEVIVDELHPTSVEVTHEYIGHIEAIRSVLVKPYIAGFIDKVLVAGGANVKAGELLFTLQQDQYLAEIQMAEAKVIGATADLEKSRLYLERIQNTASEAISKTEQDNARSAFLVAEANLAQAKADLKIATVNYNYTQITAPISGVVGNIAVTKGEYISPEGESLAYILQYNPIRVRFSMPEKDFLNLGANVDFFRTGKLILRLSNGEKIQAEGSVRFVDNQVQAGTSSIDLFADFENKKHLLLPGSYVTVLYDEEKSNVFLIDRQNISLLPDGAYVYLLKSGIIQRQKVELGDIVGEQVVVTHGLEEGDLLIISPVSSAEVGQSAKIREKEE